MVVFGIGRVTWGEQVTAAATNGPGSGTSRLVRAVGTAGRVHMSTCRRKVARCYCVHACRKPGCLGCRVLTRLCGA